MTDTQAGSAHAPAIFRSWPSRCKHWGVLPLEKGTEALGKAPEGAAPCVSGSSRMRRPGLGSGTEGRWTHAEVRATAGAWRLAGRCC